MANEKRMYVVQGDDGAFWCGLKMWSDQLRKSQVFHSLKYANDIATAHQERKCKILETSMAIIGEVQDGK